MVLPRADISEDEVLMRIMCVNGQFMLSNSSSDATMTFGLLQR